MLIVFDLDGTLSDDSHRQHYVAKPNRDFKSYYAGMSEDKPIKPVAEIMWAFMKPYPVHDIEIWTGRPEKYRSATVGWLRAHALCRIVDLGAIRMRADGDNRSVIEVKREWIEESRPDLMFDDRTSSVQAWREMGVVCLQVQQNDY